MKKIILTCAVLLMVLGVFVSFAVIERTARTADAFTHDFIYPDTLTIALLPEMNILEQRRRYEGITGYLSEKMGVNVKIKILHDYAEICQAFIDGDVDAGFFGLDVEFFKGREPARHPLCGQRTGAVAVGADLADAFYRVYGHGEEK